MFWLFIGLRAFIGIGDASYVVVAPSLICDLFAGKARSRALMIFYFAIPFGRLTPLLMPFFLMSPLSIKYVSGFVVNVIAHN